LVKLQSLRLQAVSVLHSITFTELQSLHLQAASTQQRTLSSTAVGQTAKGAVQQSIKSTL
jgi:outer membrane lipopolysaccharide assembly protein LptE/RlpB